jgi:hypothetical protein
MKIIASCSCGAKFAIVDALGSYIIPGGARNEKGQIFQVEIVFDRWREDHKLHTSEKNICH